MSCLPFDPSLYGEGIEDDYDDEPDDFGLVVDPEDLVGAFDEPFGAPSSPAETRAALARAAAEFEGAFPGGLVEFQRQQRIAAGTEHACTRCGCSESRSCPGGCVWATPTLCSRCVSS